MGHKDIVDRQLAWLAKQNFKKSTDKQIDIFDTTIVILAGLQSAYDLINSGKVPHAHTYNKRHVKALLQGARDVADLLSPVFDSPTGIPWFWYDIENNTALHTMQSNTAVVGTLIMEFHRLSDLTRDPKYRNLADRAESYLLHPKPKPLYPDLVGSNIDINTGKFTTNDIAWKSGIDSFYEVSHLSLCLDSRVGHQNCDGDNGPFTSTGANFSHLVSYQNSYLRPSLSLGKRV